MAVNQFLSIPAAATGAAPVSSATAWTFGTAVSISSATTVDMVVIGFQFQNTDIPALDVNQNILFEVTVGGVTKLQIPFNMKADTLVGYDFANSSAIQAFYFPEPYYIPRGSNVQVKVTDSIAAALTYNGVKLLYQELPQPLIETLTDNFDDNSVDTAKWNAISWGTPPTVTEASGKGVITFPNPSVNTDDGYYESDNYYDLTSSSVFFQPTTFPIGDSSSYLSLQMDSNNKIEWEYWNGHLYAQYFVGGSRTNIVDLTYDPAVHVWWKISESGGTITWWTSVDGLIWTSRATVANPITITALRVYLEALTWSSGISNPGTFEFDNFNVAPSSSNTTVTPTTGSLAITGYAPTVVIGTRLTPTTGSLTLTGYVPTVRTNTILTPTVASLSLTTFAPTTLVSDNKTATPSVASLTLTTFAPTTSVSDNKQVTPSVATLTLSTFAPTATVSSAQAVSPDTASLTLNTFDPVLTVSDHKSATPTTASLTLATFAPTVIVGVDSISVTPSPASLTLTGYAPTIRTTMTARNYFIDSSGNIFWLVSESLGLVEKV